MSEIIIENKTDSIVKYSKKFISENFSSYVEFLYRLGFDIRKQFEGSEAKKITYISKEGYKSFALSNRRNQLFGFISNHFLSRLNVNEDWNGKRVSKKGISDFRKIGNLALSEHPNSDILYIDLDTHDSSFSEIQFKEYVEWIQRLLSEVKENLGSIPVFCEVSRLNRGAHVYYRVEDTWDKEKLFLLIERVLKASDKRVKLELRKEQGKAYRIPFSWDYLPYSFERKEVIRNIPFALKETLKILDSKLYKINYDVTTGILYQNNAELLSENFISKIEGSSSIWAKGRFSKSGDSDTFQITEGNRVGGEKTIFKVLNYCLSKGMDYEQTKEFCLYCNAGSKDITAIAKNPNGKEEKELRTLFEYCKINFKSEYAPKGQSKKEANSFHSNLQYLTPIDLQWIKLEVYYTGEYIREKTYETYALVLKEAVGKHNYDVYVNKRKVGDSVRLKKELKEKLCEGAQFPDEFFHRLKAHYKIKFSVKEFKNRILNNTKLFEPIENGIKGGFLNLPHIHSCKQYRLTYKNLWREYFGDQFEKKIS
ncbi:hypothetical protein LEP1GSC186_3487 [Leptospira noguchii serovar Autumnalis str. ZUN142]|uniref:Uncharacterized protein n=1 Tax=Leptospira noguchii serovar Autumnalis str. ZUN142 TaxID=1085540 RepID=M6URE8_9LEPT|nr:hypothetical protein [Leptospira noguchii]EMO39838.1 hypothetical protein LEP1GSC186_3487 [Leptospira noguchii serovar Autumnalis str. ZUN142]